LIFLTSFAIVRCPSETWFSFLESQSGTRFHFFLWWSVLRFEALRWTISEWAHSALDNQKWLGHCFDDSVTVWPR
jgi:hypothetical protein